MAAETHAEGGVDAAHFYSPAYALNAFQHWLALDVPATVADERRHELQQLYLAGREDEKAHITMACQSKQRYFHLGQSYRAYQAAKVAIGAHGLKPHGILMYRRGRTDEALYQAINILRTRLPANHPRLHKLLERAAERYRSSDPNINKRVKQSASMATTQSCSGARPVTAFKRVPYSQSWLNANGYHAAPTGQRGGNIAHFASTGPPPAPSSN